jgi:DNA-binding NtrC family response regulator
MTIVPMPREVTRSTAMQELAVRLRHAIAAQGGVMLAGEPGSGRQFLARAIHLATAGDAGGPLEPLDPPAAAEAASRPFVVVDCAVSVDLEYRLFGNTACAVDRISGGLDSIAEGSALERALTGTLFLRQLPDMPARVQQRLARVLRDGEVRVERARGASRIEAVVLRPMGTTEGRADEDRIVPELKRRMEHTTIDTPPLRSRREDIPGLVRCLLGDLCAERQVPEKGISTQAAELLAALPWRGNIDELKAVLAALVARVPGRLIRLSDVLASVRLDGAPTALYSGTLKEARARFERDYVASVLSQHRGRMGAAARALGIQRTNLYRKVRQLSLRRPAAGPQQP